MEMVDFFQYAFFRNALWGMLLISVAGGVIGTYIITRRLVSITGGITHACFGGLGLGYYLGLSPILMAGVFAVVSSVGVEWMSSRLKVREDSAIAVIWSLGMALGVLFVFLTPGYVPELNSFLFGNILTIGTEDLWAFGLFAVLTAAVFALMSQKIIACAFDSDFSRVSGLPVRLINYTMTVLVAVCVVLTIRLVGIMLLISMLTVPVLVAETWSHRFVKIMFTSIAVSALTSVAGIFLAAASDVPCSSIIVLIQIAVYLVSRIVKDFAVRRVIQ
ncbi:MAG: metal ABC transporter permease [Muribaculum sp.]|nr:metal ABC transporter permease [Muribaculum sp.]